MNICLPEEEEAETTPTGRLQAWKYRATLAASIVADMRIKRRGGGVVLLVVVVVMCVWCRWLGGYVF